MPLISPTATDREVMQLVGARLRALRRAQGASILDTAAATGLSRMTISRAEHGDNPTLLTVVRLLRAYCDAMRFPRCTGSGARADA